MRTIGKELRDYFFDEKTVSSLSLTWHYGNWDCSLMVDAKVVSFDDAGGFNAEVNFKGLRLRGVGRINSQLISTGGGVYASVVIYKAQVPKQTIEDDS